MLAHHNTGRDQATMTTDTTTMQQLAERYAAQFETAERADGTRYVRVHEDAPDREALQDMIFAVHRNGAVLPDDTFYRLASAALDHIAETGDTDDPHEFADGMCDTYNNDLVAWLNAAPSLHGDYITEAIDEFGIDAERGFFHLIQMGQYMQAQEVFSAVVDWLTEQAEAE